MDTGIKKGNPPLVSIFCMVYNHEPYLKECLEGFLMQKCDFDFEIVIGEDCSTDKSRGIILHYANLHPQKFKLILHEKNVGAAENQRIVFANCTSKYIAMCEGDDYWTDPLKLQKQVDFLEKNSDYVLSFTDSFEYFESEDSMFLPKYSENLKDLNFSNLLNYGWFIRTATIVFRHKSLDLMALNKIEYGADYFLQLLLINRGKFHYLNKTTSVYRNHIGGISKSSSAIYLERRFGYIKDLKFLDNYLEKKFSVIIKKEINKSRINIFIFSIINSHFKYLKKIRITELLPLIYHLIKKLIKKVYHLGEYTISRIIIKVSK